MYKLKGKKNIHASVKWWAAYKFIVLLQHRRMLFSTKVLLPVKHTHTSSGKIVLVVSKHFPMPLSQPLTLFSLTSSLSFPFCILPLFPALPLIPSEPGTPLGDKATVFPEKFFKRRSSYCDQEEDEDRTDIRGMAAHMYSQCGSQRFYLLLMMNGYDGWDIDASIGCHVTVGWVISPFPLSAIPGIQVSQMGDSQMPGQPDGRHSQMLLMAQIGPKGFHGTCRRVRLCKGVERQRGTTTWTILSLLAHQVVMSINATLISCWMPVAA